MRGGGLRLRSRAKRRFEGENRSGAYDYGSTVTLTAEPLSGYKFVRWSDDENAPASRTVTITGNAAYTAMFELDTISQMLANFSEVYEIYADEKTVYEVYVDKDKIFG